MIARILAAYMRTFQLLALKPNYIKLLTCASQVLKCEMFRLGKWVDGEGGERIVGARRVVAVGRN
jgi:hypothetical protein